MKKMIIFAISLGLVVCACASDDSDDNDLGSIFIGIFDDQWEVQGVDDYFFGIFRDGLENTSSGKLTGFEDLPQEDQIDMINGTFDGLDLKFTIPRKNGSNAVENVNFTGKMTPTSETDHTIIRIDLTSSKGEKLVLLTQ